jgi:tetratricopeptide (TPR) repeat protein
MILADVLFVLIGTALAWWISGYDTRVTGEDKHADIMRRAIRCGITLVLLAMATVSGFGAIFIFLVLGLFWAGCGAEFFSQQFHKLIDPEDKREFDPKETERKLDLLAQLIREHKMTEALDMCQKLEESGEVSPLALDAMIHRLYQEILDSIPTAESLSEVRRLRERKQFDQAELQLKQVLAGQPKNWAAMLLLMRIYAEDLSRPEKALALLQSMNKQPQLHKAFVKFARQSIKEWSMATEIQPVNAGEIATGAAVSSPSTTVVTEVSVDELLKNNQLSTAIELLEKAIAEAPGNFELRMKLAEAYGVYCADLHRAERIIQKIENSSTFTPQEIELARAKLKDWRAGRRS